MPNLSGLSQSCTCIKTPGSVTTEFIFPVACPALMLSSAQLVSVWKQTERPGSLHMYLSLD